MPSARPTQTRIGPPAMLTRSDTRALQSMAREASAELARIADWWTTNSVDQARGGFHGEIDATGAPRPGGDKSVILNTRLLWFFSEAGAQLGSRACLQLADRAADYVSAHFLDQRHGGLFWMLDAEGQPVETRKQAYAQAFGVYAFSAHFAATNDHASLDKALGLFETLETHSLDHEGDGYWEARAEDFAPIADVRLSPRDLNAPKSMNTHLHVLEAYAALYRVAPSPVLRRALERCLRIMCERVFDRRGGHLRLFFDANWRHLDDTVSFGHDIEASWLICEAAEALGESKLVARARACALDLADAALAEAIGPNGEVFEERHGDGRISRRRVWWIQAEALVGFLNAFALTGDARFLDASERVWRFIKAHQLDLDGGEWRELSTLDPPVEPAPLRAGPWKCPYHTGRAMMEAQRRVTGLLRDASQPAEARS